MNKEIVKDGNDFKVKKDLPLCERKVDDIRNMNDDDDKQKRYYADIQISWGVSFDAKNKEEAIGYLKEQYKDDYGIDLHDDEIIKLEEEEWVW